MLDDMTKEELIAEVKKMREELYHLKMAKEFNLSPNVPRPDGYATSETKVDSDLPTYRSGQIPSSSPFWPANFGKPWLGAILDMGTPGASKEEVNEVFTTAKEKMEAAVEKIIAYRKEAEEEDTQEFAGWCLRITDFEGIKFLFLKDPDGNQMSLEVDTRPEVNGVPNRPQVLTQFVATLGRVNIAGVWPRWWKLEDTGEWFVLSRHDLSYTITPKEHKQETLLRNFFKHLNTVRVPSIDEADGA